jgi:hypothetical protein
VFASVALPPAYLAAVLLLGRTLGAPYGLPSGSVAAIIKAVGASKSRAYEVLSELSTVLPTLVRAPGRPQQPAPTPAPDRGMAVTRAVLGYVMKHPGCVDRGAARQRYTDAFRRFILELRAQHDDLALDVFAHATEIPLGTLKDWLVEPPSERATLPETAPAEPQPAPTPPSARTLESLHIQTVLDAWTRWNGGFREFCRHVQCDLRVPFGRGLVERILAAHGKRKPASREGRRSSDELALRGSFRTWFPGAQWIGDGMQVPVIVDDRRFVFNVELDVDACSGAFVGASVRDTEDSQAVIDAFHAGVATTGAAPLALLLDNKPSNHTPEVDAALGDTIRIRATPERPQNKAHVEGAFGLFSQILPLLSIDTRRDPGALARSFLGLVVDVWARTTNHRPRSDRNARSRVELYSDTPSEKQLEQGRRELRELAARQEQARLTLQARRRPEVLALLDDYFARLALLDPERHIRTAIAGYPKNAIVDGLLLFDARRRAKTLPDGVDARYLLGIVKNIATKTEGEIIAETLYRGRIEIRDRFLAAMRAERDALRSSEPNIARLLGICAEKALAAEGPLGRAFWLDAIVETLRDQPDSDRERLYLHVARQLESCFDVAPRERHDAVRYVADRLVPIT